MDVDGHYRPSHQTFMHSEVGHMKRIMIALLAVGLAACNSDSTAPSVSLYGNYQLRTVNGFTLPVTFTNGVTLTSDLLTLNTDNSFTDAAQFSDGTVSVEQGFFTANNGAITFTDLQTGAQFSGSLSGSVLTEVDANGLTETFQKE